MLLKKEFSVKRAFMALLLMPVFFSCTTYNKSMNAYYSSMQSHDYDKALQKLGKNKFMKRDRNRLLYFVEAGKLYRLKNEYAISNRYFNQADDFLESSARSVGDIAVGNLLNPMQQTYRGEDFEKFMIHFYKALNYAALGETGEAVVEARRISLVTDAQGDKFRNNSNRYSADAFALNLQGMIYETAGDLNNAFISYRNAADIYLNSSNNYYGISIPDQLKTDLLRTATAMGFNSDAERYEKLLKVSYQESTGKNGEVILFFEEGQAPVKKEKNFILTTAGGQIGNFNFIDQDGHQASVPFNYDAYGISAGKLSSVRNVRIAMPVYQVVSAQPASLEVVANGTVYTPQQAQNINSIAIGILKERLPAEMGKALARQLTKKLVEKGTQAAVQGIAKSQEKKSDDNASDAEKEKKRQKNEDNAKAAGEIAGLLVNVANSITEKADTRNWQSLPAFISYVRLPLYAGENIINITAKGKTTQLKLTGGSGLQMIGQVID